MASIDKVRLNRTVGVDDLVRSYLRYKDWMDHDAESSAYCVKEVIVMQELFGTAYIKAPPNLASASYEELLACMEKRQDTLCKFTYATHTPEHEDGIDDIYQEIEKTQFRSEVHYFVTLFEALMQCASSAQLNDPGESEVFELDKEPLEDHFEKTTEAMFETIRDFIVAEHPGIDRKRFSVDRLQQMGLPPVAPAQAI